MMKYLAIFLLFTFSANAHVIKEYEVEEKLYMFEDIINSTIYNIINNLTEPIKVEALNLQLPTEGLLTGSFNLSNLEITGIKQLEIPVMTIPFIPTQINFTAVLPSLNIHTDYALDVLVGTLVPLYGKGPGNVHLSDITITGFGKVQLKNGPHTMLGVSDITIQINLGGSTFDIHGLLDDESFSLIVSAIMNDTVTKFINEEQELITKIISPILEILINSILNGGGNQPTTTPPPTQA